MLVVGLRLLLLISFSLLAQAGNFTRFVNPLIATRGGGGFGGWGCQARNPGAMSPTPFLRLGPDTTRFDAVLGEAWSHLNRHSGYFGSDSHIRAFSHTHVQGAGDADLGCIGVMLTRADVSEFSTLVTRKPLPLPFPPVTLDRSPFAAPFTHSDEYASPGFYAVGLPTLNARVELAASGTHAGVHRYTCSNGLAPGGGGGNVSGPCTLAIDVCHRTHSNACGNLSTVTVTAAIGGSNGTTLIEGMHQDRGEFVRFNYTGINIFFSMLVSAVDDTDSPVLPQQSGTWSDYAATSGATSATVGVDLDSLGAFLLFPSPARILLRVGLSTVSADGARRNLNSEQSDSSGGLKNFEDIVTAMDKLWDEALSAVQVTLPFDAGSGVNDRAVLDEGFATHSSRPSGGGDSESSWEHAQADLQQSTLEAFLLTPHGVALAVQHGWISNYPAELIDAIAAARNATVGTAIELAVAPRLIADPVLALSALRSGAEAQRSSRVTFTDGTSDLQVFYSLLYLTLCAPSTYSNSVDGVYLGFDFLTHPPAVPNAAFLSDLSLWDTHRSQAPLMALIAPKLLADAAASLIAMGLQGEKGMPRWPFANLYTGDMIGHHGLELLVDCVLISHACDGRVTLAEAAAAVAAATASQDASLADYLTLGFVPFGQGAASETLEWAYNDFSAAAFANATGNASAALALTARSHAWRNVLAAQHDAEGGLFGVVLPRAENGSFINVSSVWLPHPFNSFYTEGNAAQWTWSVPHDLQGLVSSFPGGASAYASFLSDILAKQTSWTSVFSTR